MSQDDSIAVCTVETTKWTFNDKGQSPCEVANTLLGECQSTAGPFITPLQPGNIYVQPLVFDLCSCSTVTYSLVSACAICQGGNISFWAGVTPSWSQNCTTDIIADGSYPLNIPPDTSIPIWAYQNISEFFNPAIADGIAGEHHPDVSFMTSAIPATEIQTTSATATPTTIQASSETSSSQRSGISKSGKDFSPAALAGTIAGAVVGVLCLCFIIFGCVYCYKRRKNPRRYFEGVYQTPEQENNAGFRPPRSTMWAGHYTPYKLYDPADPSTYPPASALDLSTSPNMHTSPSLPDINLVSPISTPTSSTSRTAGHARQYSGESDSTYTRTATSRHTRQYSSESDSTYTRAFSHSRQSSTDTSSISTKSLVSPISSNRSKNFLSGYHPSGIVYRAIRED